MNVEHLVRGWLEKLVHLQLFQMAHKLPRHLVGILKKKSFECGTLDIDVMKSKTWNLDVTMHVQEIY